MFNLLVKYNAWADGRDTMPADRVFEYTDNILVNRFKPRGQLDFASLIALPTLFLQETSGLGDQVARVGKITRARAVGRQIVLEYSYDLSIPAIPNKALQAFASDIDIEEFQFSRTHWSILDADLFQALLRNVQPRRPRPMVFQLAEYENIEPSLVSAMMPFHPDFDAVYATLQRTAEAVGLRCRRADDIWESPLVIQDVVSLMPFDGAGIRLLHD